MDAPFSLAGLPKREGYSCLFSQCLKVLRGMLFQHLYSDYQKAKSRPSATVCGHLSVMNAEPAEQAVDPETSKNGGEWSWEKPTQGALEPVC